jgi:hypothetical protein
MDVLPALLQELKAVCGGFPDTREVRGGNILMADFGLSAFSMFFMQSGSFLSHQRALEKAHSRSNCQTLFGMEHIPTDNYIRDNLDPVDPVHLQPLFNRMETQLEKPAMKQAFQRLKGRTLIAWDGTEYFCSYKINCPHCLTRKRSNGKVESYHTLLSATVVAPGTNRVVPLMPEFIANEDGAEKQDCERNAVKRWFNKHGARVKRLNPVYLGDDLFACQPVAEMVRNNGDDFIFTCKEASHKGLYDFIRGTTREQRDEKIRKRSTTETFRYRWIENVPIRDGKDAKTGNQAAHTKSQSVSERGFLNPTCQRRAGRDRRQLGRRDQSLHQKGMPGCVSTQTQNFQTSSCAIPQGKADQDRRGDREPWPLCCVSDGRSHDFQKSLCRHPTNDRRTSTAD